MGHVRRGGWVLAVAAVAGGCGTSGERPMTAALFMPPGGAIPAGSDRSAEAEPARSVVPPDLAVAGGTTPKQAMVLTSAPSQSFETVRPLTPLTPAGDPPVAAAAAPAATTRPADPPPVATDVYMTVGGVLAQVNDTPIYANTVLALLDRELAAHARELDPDPFRRYAAEQINKQTMELIRDELDYASAYKTLSEDDKKLAAAITAEKRAAKVKESGGSAELAKRRAAEDGYDFDDLMKQQSRRTVLDIYQQRQIFPQVQVSAGDMREFYAAHAEQLYGDKDRLKFRVIEVDPARAGGRDAARAVAESIRAKAAAGADFAALASSAQNDDEGLRSTGGDPGGWLDRGSYRVDAVEQALWPLPPGGVTPVVGAEDVFYVAKLEDKHEGRTKPFDDPAVQDDVTRRLTQQQMSALWERVRDSAAADAVVYAPPEQMNTALEMVMQKYPRWAAR